MTISDAIFTVEENDGADEQTTIEAWQLLIDDGIVWRLQGWFGRTAKQLIDNGVCTTPSKIQ